MTNGTDNHTHLRRLIEAHFNLDELRSLCADLGVRYEDLGEGLSLSGRVRELVDYMDRHGRLLDLILYCRQLRPQVEWPHVPEPTEAPCPYKGLHAFQEEDAHLFFGREKVAKEVVEAVQRQSLTAVIGPSGSGKSSLVFAGALPRLRQEGTWLAIKFRPGNQPFYNLAAALVVALEPAMSEVDRLTQNRKLAHSLNEGTVLLADVTRRLLQKEAVESQCLLIADQFEELYTLCPKEETRRRYLDLLLTAVTPSQTNEQQTTRLLLTLRADFLGQALSYRPLADALQGNDVMLGPMSRQELRQAILEPVRTTGISFEERLVERILGDIAPANHQPEPGDLPLLEFALTQLWQQQAQGRLTHVAYENMGQVRGALAHHAEEVYGRLDAAEQARLPAVLTQLVHPGAGTEDTRRLAGRQELDEAGWQLVQKMAGAEARLVVTGRDEAGGKETAELVHEALIRRWGRLRGWMEEYRAFRQWQDRLRTAMDQWQSSDHDAGALLRGAPLAEAENWLAQRAAELSAAECAFIQAGLDERDREAAEREAQRQRELELQRQRAEEEARRASAVRRALAVILMLLALAVAAAVFGFIQQDRAQTNAQEAEAQATQAAIHLDTAESERAKAETQLLAALSQVVYQDSHDRELAALLAIEAYRVNRQEANGLAWLVVDSALRPLLEQVPLYFNNTLLGHEGDVWSLAFSPDGEILASSGFDGTVRLWDPKDPQTTPTVLTGHEGWVESVAFSPDGKTLASGDLDGTIRLWDLEEPQAAPAMLSGNPGPVSSLAFSPDGQTLASGSGGRDRAVRLWDLAQPQAAPAVLVGHQDLVLSVAFSPDGQMVASGSEDGTIRLWDPEAPQADPAVLTGGASVVFAVAFSPDGETLASGGTDGTVHLWDPAQPEAAPMALTGHEFSVRSLAFSPDGEFLATGDENNTIRLWRPAQPETAPVVLTDLQDLVLSLAFSPDGQTLAAGGDDGTIRLLWDLADRERVPTVLTNHEGVRSLALSPDGQTLATGGVDGTIRLWQPAEPGAEPTLLTGHEGDVWSLAFSPDGQTLASGGDDGSVRLWHPAPPEAAPTTLTGHEGPVVSLAFSPDGQTLATGGFDNTVRLWQPEEPEATPTLLTRHEDTVWALAFSPDGQTLASGDGEGTIRLRGPEVTLSWSTGVEFGVRSLAFSPDGQTLATGDGDGAIRLWQPEEPGSTPAVLAGHESQVWALAFSPDGQTLASGGLDGTVRLWNPREPRATPATLTGHGQAVRSLAFSPDGQMLASGGDDGSVRLWRLLDALVEIGCNKVRRNLSWGEWRRYRPEESYRPTCPNLPSHFTVRIRPVE